MIRILVPGQPQGKGRAIAIDRLRDLLCYDPKSGALTWKVQRGTRGKVGSNAGSITAHGYLAVGVDGVRSIPAHRIAWALIHGEWPSLEVDHINGDRTDNRFSNLRLVTTGENHQNMRKARCDSKTGVLGVSKYGGRYRAQIQVSGKKHWLGEYHSIEEASAAYVAAKRQLHPKGTL